MPKLLQKIAYPILRIDLLYIVTATGGILASSVSIQLRNNYEINRNKYDIWRVDEDPRK